MKTYRFWTYWNSSWCKLELIDQQEIILHRSYAHDEGYSSETEHYTRFGDIVELICHSAGSDCDGRSSSTTELSVNIHAPKLDTRTIDQYSNEVYGHENVPNWQKNHAEQWDQFAELAGY